MCFLEANSGEHETPEYMLYRLQLNRMFILEYKINNKGNEYYNVSLWVPNKVPMEKTEECVLVNE